MNFNNRQKTAGEMALRSMSDKANEFYRGASPLDFYEVETDWGNRYYLRGAFEFDDLTFEEAEEWFEDMQDEMEKENNVSKSLEDEQSEEETPEEEDEIKLRPHL